MTPDTGLPEVCDKCDRDCHEPCEAFKRFVAITTLRNRFSEIPLVMTAPFWTELDKVLEGKE